MDILTNPAVIGGAVIVGVVAVVALLLLSRKQQGKTVEGYAKARNYPAAAALAQKEGDFSTALEYYLLAGQPLQAAKLAHRLGRLRQAAEIYQSAGDHEQAAKLFKEAGLEREAREASKEHEALAGGGRRESGSSRESSADFLSEAELADQAVRKFRAILAKAKKGDIDAQQALLEAGRDAAEACLEAGETQRAAQVFRDAGLEDQAINLYVNVLGDPAAAAKIFAGRGDHERAAALYEAAGAKERALASWIKWADKADDPLVHLDEVDRLGDTAGRKLLETVVQNRDLTQDNADLFYRVAREFEERKATSAAIDVLKQIQQTVPGFRDVAQRIGRLEVVIKTEARTSPSPPPKQTPPSDDKATVQGLPSALEASRRLEHHDEAPASPRDDSSAEELDPSMRELSEGDDEPTPGEPSLDEPSLGRLEARVIEKLAGEVATAVAKEAAKLARPVEPQLVVEPDAAVLRRTEASTARRASKTLARGLERIPITIELAVDPHVEAARYGPKVQELKDMIGGAPPDLGNIEVYYRLGLAQAAAGNWREARKAFDAVEETSPGYRDAGKRAEELSSWEDALGLASGGGGQVSDRYELRGEIGRGGMAVVYRARDNALGREVALKFLSEEVSNHEGMLELFQREARAAAALNHPNIVTVYDVGTLDGRAFICMEFVTGETVEELLDEQGKLKVFDALRIAENILSALDYAHGKNIVHRDIKPSNMMRNELGVVKLMDFGLAKSMEGKAKTTMVAGTPLYMAPEQFTGKNLDARTDVFAFGATLYEMLAGRPPFEGMRRDTPPDPLSSINPAVPKLLEKMVHRSLELDKEKRFSSAGEMLQITRQLLAAIRSYLAGGAQPEA